MSNHFVANFIRFPVVEKFWKSVKIWQSYRDFKGGNFFETQCIGLSDGTNRQDLSGFHASFCSTNQPVDSHLVDDADSRGELSF